MDKKITLSILTIMCLTALCSCGNAEESSSTSTTESQATEQLDRAVDFDAESIIQYFIDNKAPDFGEHIVYDESTDPNELLGRPDQYTSKADFSITTIEVSDESDPYCATIEVFDNETNAQARYDYIDAIYNEMPILKQYMYMNGTVILRMDFDTLPSDEKKYEELLDSYIESLN